jgi:hypothetical protein
MTADVRMPLGIQLPQMGGAVNGMMIGGGVQIQGNVIIRQVGPGGFGQVVQNGAAQVLPAGTTEYYGFALEDAKGRRFSATHGQVESSRFSPEGTTLQVTITFHPVAADQEAGRLVFTASRAATIDVPFTVKDVPLP